MRLQSRLNDTEGGQLAILTCGIAAWRVLAERGVVPGILARMSIGQYTALVAAGVLSFRQALELVRFRSRLMEAEAPGATVAIIVLDLPRVEAQRERAEAETGEILDIALYNSTAQYVLAGGGKAVARAQELARELRDWRVITPNVRVAVHSRLMAGVAEQLKIRVAQTPMAEPTLPIVLNSTATVAASLAEIRHELSRQCVSPVRWVHAIDLLTKQGYQSFIEVGAGEMIKKLNASYTPRIHTLATGRGAIDIDVIVKTLTGPMAR